MCGDGIGLSGTEWVLPTTVYPHEKHTNGIITTLTEVRGRETSSRNDFPVDRNILRLESKFTVDLVMS